MDRGRSGASSGGGMIPNQGGTTGDLPLNGTNGNTLLEDYMNMDERQLIDLANDLRSTPDSYYWDKGLNATNPLQRLVDKLDLNDKPVVLDDSSFDRMVQSNPNLVPIYRGVYGDSKLSGADMSNNTMYSDSFYVGDGIHGHGLYFSTSQDTARSYSDGFNGSTMQAVLNPNTTKMIDETTLRNMANSDPVYNSSTMRNISQYALYKGYNTIYVPGGNFGADNSKAKGGEDFYVALSRDALIFRQSSGI